MDDTERLFRDLYCGDSERVVRSAHALGDLGVKAATPHLLRILSNASSWDLRNAAAIGLKELGASEAVPVIRQYLKDPSNWANCGTLVYALHNMDSRAAITELVELIMHGPYEAREMALQALEAMSVPPERDIVQRIISTLQKNLKDVSGAADDEVSEYAEYAMKLLKERWT